MSMAASDLRRWVGGRRAAEQRELEELADDEPVPAASLRRGLGLIAVARALLGWPLPEDPVRCREDELVRARWTRLQIALARR